MIVTNTIPDGVNNLAQKMFMLVRQGTSDVAEEILRLSNFEVPHDTGQLQTSGHVEPGQDWREGEKIVGYNKVYAARLHENPQYRFQKGRKGKYLEDPIKRNLHVFIDYIKNVIDKGLR